MDGPIKTSVEAEPDDEDFSDEASGVCSDGSGAGFTLSGAVDDSTLSEPASEFEDSSFEGFEEFKDESEAVDELSEREAEDDVFFGVQPIRITMADISTAINGFFNVDHPPYNIALL